MQLFREDIDFSENQTHFEIELKHMTKLYFGLLENIPNKYLSSLANRIPIGKSDSFFSIVEDLRSVGYSVRLKLKKPRVCFSHLRIYISLVRCCNYKNLR